MSFKGCRGEWQSVITSSLLLGAPDHGRDTTNSSFCPATIIGVGKITSSLLPELPPLQHGCVRCVSRCQILEPHYYRGPRKRKQEPLLPPWSTARAGAQGPSVPPTLSAGARTSKHTASHSFPTSVSDGKCFARGKLSLFTSSVHFGIWESTGPQDLWADVWSKCLFKAKIFPFKPDHVKWINKTLSPKCCNIFHTSCTYNWHIKLAVIQQNKCHFCTQLLAPWKIKFCNPYKAASHTVMFQIKSIF